VPERVELPAQMADIDTLSAAVRLAAIGKQRDPERAFRGNHGFLSRDGLAPMLAPNTVKSYGGVLLSPHAMPRNPHRPHPHLLRSHLLRSHLPARPRPHLMCDTSAPLDARHTLGIF